MRIDYRVTLVLDEAWVQKLGTNPDDVALAFRKDIAASVVHLLPNPESKVSVETVNWSIDAGLEKLPAEEIHGEGQRISERFVTRFQRAGELERTDQINVDARGAGEVNVNPKHQRNRLATCPVCWERYPITDDPIENHHRAMLHKTVCGKAGSLYTPEQFRGMVDEHDAQPHVKALHEWTRRGLPIFSTAETIEAHDDACRDRGLPVPSTVAQIEAYDRAHPQLVAGSGTAELPAAPELGDEIARAEYDEYERDRANERPARVWWKPWTWF